MESRTSTDRLQRATRDIHSRLESTEYAAALKNGTIAVDSYVGYLRVLAILHGTLEPLIMGAAHPVLTNIWSAELSRTTELSQDLDFFRMQLIPDAPAAIEAAQRAAAEIRRLAADRPVALVGAVYTLYGSSLGAKVLRATLEAGLGVRDSRGACYFSRHGGDGTREWHAAARRIDASGIDPSGIDAAIQTAMLFFQCIFDAFTVLHPLEHTALSYSATTLNPDSGNHPVPQERDVLRAVLRTTDRTLTDYPYILYRFGARGRRFTDADGGWLATLPEHGEVEMSRQLDWIRTVLSSRGLPHIVVARHLHVLADELIGAVYDQTWRPLLSGAAERIYRAVDARVSPELRRQQQSVLFQSLGGGLGRGASDPQADTLCRETTELIASALVDFDRGVVNAVDSILSYLADRNRFSTAWVDAVHDTVRVFRTS